MLNSLLRDIINDFNEKDVEYCILRNYSGFDFINNKDIDLLINQRQIKLIDRIIEDNLEEIKFKRKESLKQITYSFKINNNRWFSIDLNKYVTIKTDPFELNTSFFGTKLKIDHLKLKKCEVLNFYFYVLEYEMEILILANHFLIKKKDEYFLQLNAYCKDSNLNLDVNNYRDLLTLINRLMRELKLERDSKLCQFIILPKYLFNHIKFKMND